MPIGEYRKQKDLSLCVCLYCQQCPSKQAMSEVLKITPEKGSVDSFAVETGTGTAGLGGGSGTPSAGPRHRAGTASLKPGLGMRVHPQTAPHQPPALT